MLEGIKSKLGFADANPHYDDGYYDEGFDDYSEEYGEYGPDYNEDDFPADDAPGSRYEPYAPVTSRPARASHARSSARSSSVGSAKLVSIDDVRAHTQVPESLNRDPLPPRRVTSPSSGSYRGDRTMVEAAQPAPANTPIARAAAAANRERSESLELAVHLHVRRCAERFWAFWLGRRGANGNHRFGRYRGNRHGDDCGVRSVRRLRGRRGGQAQPLPLGHRAQAGQLRRGRAHREGSQGGGCGGARAA